MAAGNVYHWGLSEAGPQTIARAHAALPLTAVQSECSLCGHEPDSVILPLLQQLGIGHVHFSSLGKGILAGTNLPNIKLAAEDSRSQIPRFAADAMAAHQALVSALTALAAAKGISAAQLALAWMPAKARFIMPLFGTGDPVRMYENMGVASVVLTADEFARVDRLSMDFAASGTRYPASMMAKSGL